MNKTTELLKLAKKRMHYDLNSFKNQYKNIGDYHEKIYECDFVSPYSKTAHNVNADVMIFLQDWSSDKPLNGEICKDSIKYGHTPSLPTNKYLKKLLSEQLHIKFEDTYSTNLFPFIKMGNMSSNIPVGDMKHAAIEFALPQIDIISPKIIISLGLSSFNALRRAVGLKPCKNIEEGISSPFNYNESTIFCQAHTGQLGRNNRNRGGVDRVSNDWKMMASKL